MPSTEYLEIFKSAWMEAPGVYSKGVQRQADQQVTETLGRAGSDLVGQGLMRDDSSSPKPRGLKPGIFL